MDSQSTLTSPSATTHGMFSSGNLPDVSFVKERTPASGNDPKDGSYSHQDFQKLIAELERLKQSQQELEAKQYLDASMAKFAEVLRWRMEYSLETWADQLLMELVPYVSGLQGTLYVIEESTLRLTGKYAAPTDTLTHIELGQGITGQVARTGKTVYLDNPNLFKRHTTTSLAEIGMQAMLVQPLVHNEQVEGVLELGTLDALDDVRRQLIRQLSEALAANLSTIRNQIRIQGLYQEAQEKTEQLSAQEEEMRQNMEEMQTTQDEMQRNELRIQGLYQEAQEKTEQLSAQEEEMRQNMEELQTTQDEMQRIQRTLTEQRNLLTAVHDSNPDRISVKDENFRFIMVNESFAQAMSKAKDDLIGKDEIEAGISEEQVFGNAENGNRGLRSDDTQVLNGETLHYPSTPENDRILEMSKLPLRDASGKITGIITIARDVTEQRKQEELIRTQNSR